MRHLLVVLLLAGGCFDFSFDFSDPCPERAGGGLFPTSKHCSCPLISEVGPALEGQACSVRGLACAADWLSPSCTCESEPLRWNCGVADLAIPLPLDLSIAEPPRDFLSSD